VARGFPAIASAALRPVAPPTGKVRTGPSEVTLAGVRVGCLPGDDGAEPADSPRP
jgi:hypothetical protein